jgi:deoxyribodipyrimidine photolyase-related protein
MRKKHDVMMLNGKPLSGKWNYDAENRKKLPTGTSVPEPLVFNHDVTEVVDQIKEAGIQTIGTINAKAYAWPVSRKESIELLHYFLEHCLPQFGDYQDAMHQNYWSLFHARLSFSLNAKMISPKEVVDAAINYWETNQDTIHISQIEGFVRQILGWREYMRGIYWWKMPHFKTLNFFENKNPLPDWFWTGETKMACLKSAITQSLEYSYAHHIQRLMVTGNFALLAGVDPDEVDAWYLGIYIDAIEWVEITNTRGMSQFADGGIIATKPYVSSASYIHKMSSHCKSCFYDHKKKTGEGACPFNSLYWNFYDQHSDKLSGNPRIGMMLNIWNKMKPETKAEYLLQASKYLSEVNYL